ncbi:MAG: DUF262 domain-containing protein, partial [Desulfovibrio sp.]|nr:DUF262 domain-containing protein [Desulfovibrio sp.]
MPKIAASSSLDTSLKELLEGIGKGSIQLPEFQRGWTWDDLRIRAILATLTQGYPMGAVMRLQCGGAAGFKARPFEGAGTPAGEPEFLVLDGQQRLTSIFRAAWARNAVETKTETDQAVRRFYYLDVAKCLDPAADRIDAVVSVPEGRRILKNFNRDVVLDISSPEKEWEAGMFPMNILFDGYAREKWGNGYKKLHGYADEAIDRYSAFLEEVLAVALEYKLPVITLSRETPKEAVCQVFEHVNTGGVSLTVFELVTASFAAGDFDLRRDWTERVRPAVRGEGEALATDVMKAVDEKDFLTAVALYASHERRLLEGRETGSSCKRKDILELSLADYLKHRDAVIEGFRMARDFLLDERIYMLKDLPYVSQLVPLAAVCAAAGRKLLADPKAKEELRRWYWCGVFGEMYGGMTDTVFANDMDDVPRAMKAAAGGLPPVPVRTAGAAFFSAVRLLSMKSKNSAAYKGVAALVWKPRGTQAGGLDFLNGIPVDPGRAIEKKPDIHHIFPKKWCLERGDAYARTNMDSIVNKTPLDPETNRLIGGDAPSIYERKLEKASGKDATVIRDRIESHLVDWDAFMANDFKTHFVFRAKKLLNLIEDAMGREIADRDSAQTVERFGASLADPDRPSAPVLPAPKPAPAVSLPAELFSAVKDYVLAFGGVEVRESEERPWYCSFLAGKGRFLAVLRQRDRVKLRVYVKDGELDDPQGLTAPGNRDGERVLFVQDEAELEAAMPLVRQSYDAAVKETAKDEEALFGDASPDVRGAWETLKTRVLALDGAGLSFRDGYPWFSAGGRKFLGAVPQKRSLKLYLGVPEGEIDDPDERAVLMNGPVCSVGNYKVFARDATDVDALMPLVMQAFGEKSIFPEDAPAVALYARSKEIDEAEAGDNADGEQSASDGKPAGSAHEGMNETDAVRLWPAVEAFAKDHGREPSAGAIDPSERRLAEVLAFMRILKAQKMREEQAVEAGDGKDDGKPEDSLDAIMPLVRQGHETVMAKSQEMDPASRESLGLRFWTAFCGHAAGDPEMQAAFRPRKPQPQSWHEFPSGVPSIGIELCVRTRMKCVQAG